MEVKEMLVGERILLKRLAEEDWQLRYQWMSDPDVSSTLSSGLGFPLSATRVKDQIISFLNDSISRVDFLVINKENNEPIGFVHLNGIDMWARRAELGIFIGEKEYRGKGYGAEITQLIIKFAFQRLNLHKVWLTVDADNPGGRVNHSILRFRDAAFGSNR
jgi:RimJ/RimL family protein N-acetyltransferase